MNVFGLLFPDITRFLQTYAASAQMQPLCSKDDHAQLVVAGSAGTVADPDIISVRDAFSILFSHPEIFNGYLPGELQEAFLTI